MADEPCEDCAKAVVIDARISLATSLAVTALALTGLLLLTLIGRGVLSWHDLLPGASHA